MPQQAVNGGEKMKYIWFDTVSIGQELSIREEKYICRAISLCESNGSSFCEFILYTKVNNKYKYKYLEVELVHTNNYKLHLYYDIDVNRYNALLENDFVNSKTYCAKATTTKCKGNFDASIGETFEYTEYYCDDRILSIEDWHGEVEYSYGKEIELEDVVLGDIVENKLKNSKLNTKNPIFIVGIIALMFFSFIFFMSPRIFSSYCSPTCSRYHKDWCCKNTDKCLVTHKVCKSMYDTSSRSIRNRSYGSRNPVGGGTSFGK